jgi:glycosyltransferase involved in cell wall biosynthesis
VKLKVNRLNIFGVVNHVGNQYEMLKLAKKYPVKFHYLENNVRRWSNQSARPEPTSWLTDDEFEWVQYYEPGKYDLAILHVDQQHTDPRIGKGWLYEDMNELIQDIPKMVINHGTPMWDDYYTEEYVINGGIVQTMKGPIKLKGMKEKLGDNFMIVNSYEAVERWGWGYPLIHGLDPDEWFDRKKEPRVVLSLSPGGLDKYYNRELVTAIKSAVHEKTGLDVFHVNVNVKFEADNWTQYREFIGSSLINLSPYKDSPMPRSRTEAMLSGACVLTSKYHGAADFIEHGVDGFVVPDNPLSYANAIHHLVNGSYRDAVAIGQRGKAKAKKLFNQNRYQADLYDLIGRVANGEKPVWDGSKIW